jgi:hypothetical protein
MVLFFAANACVADVSTIKMAFALYDFFETEQIEVGATALIRWNDDEDKHDLLSVMSNSVIVRVYWDPRSAAGKSKRTGCKTKQDYPARVLKISGESNFSYMCTQLAVNK